jgi:hypothetical protein
MAITDWKWRVYIFIRAVDVTPAAKAAFAQVYVDGDCLESYEDQLRMFDNVVRLSLSGEEPAQVYGVNTAAKTSMRDGFKALLDVLPQARYAVVANTTLPEYEDGELVFTNFPGIVPSGQIVTWDKALQYLYNEFGLIVIVPEDEF